MLLASCAFVAFAARVAFNADLQKEPPGSTPGCSVIGQDLLGMEDIVTWRQSVLIADPGSVVPGFKNSPEKIPQGGLVAVDFRSGEPRLHELEIKNAPDSWPFHPHGISLSNRTGRLYVVNHGGASSIGTRIEVFQLAEGKDGLPAISWLMAVADGQRFGNCVLNSVVEAGEGELYVSQYNMFSVAEKGEHHPSTVLERVQKLVQTLFVTLGLGGTTGVYRCLFDVESRTTTSCKMAASGFVHANGLDLSADLKTLWVSDPIRKELRVFDRDLSTGALTENHSKYMKLNHVVDNVHYDAASGELWTGTITKVISALAPQPDGTMKVPGSFMVGRPDGRGGFNWHDEVAHNGEALDWISACARTDHPASGKTWAVCGGPHGPGLLVCPLK